MWIGSVEKGCCHDQIESAMWIGKVVTGSFHVKVEVKCGFETDDRRWYFDLNWDALWIETDF
jgi:hypothetical protein